MTKQDQINFIRQKCVEANPEIVEVKMGCEVYIQAYDELYNGFPVVIGATSICKKHKQYREECCAEEDGCSVTHGAVIRWGSEEDGWGTMTRKESEFKVIGRPIRLADVLLALHQTQGSFRYDIDMVERSKWKLRADDLEKQSEEAISFLYELLK
jgi:hypothetical protein